MGRSSVDAGDEPFEIAEHTDAVRGAFFRGPDDPFITATDGGTGLLWDEGGVRARVIGHIGPVNHGVIGVATGGAAIIGVQDGAALAGEFRGNVMIIASGGTGSGNLSVGGTLSKSAGSFQIDHPLDPDNKWLRHSFVESPDMMNVYNGNAIVGDDGEVEVILPDYFEALNREFRYQLTAVGGRADLWIEEEISGNRFVIGSNTPGIKVSWQVTGIRQDTYARDHPIVVEEPKSDESSFELATESPLG